MSETCWTLKASQSSAVTRSSVGAQQPSRLSPARSASQVQKKKLESSRSDEEVLVGTQYNFPSESRSKINQTVISFNSTLLIIDM